MEIIGLIMLMIHQILLILRKEDLQCINAGYLMVLNSFSALNIMSFSGAARDLALKSISFMLYLSQASFSNSQPPSFLTPLRFIMVLFIISKPITKWALNKRDDS